MKTKKKIKTFTFICLESVIIPKLHLKINIYYKIKINIKF